MAEVGEGRRRRQADVAGADHGDGVAGPAPVAAAGGVTPAPPLSLARVELRPHERDEPGQALLPRGSAGSPLRRNAMLSSTE